MTIIDYTKVTFAGNSMFDDAGRVFFYQDRVFRAIYSEELAFHYSYILSKSWIDKVFEAGLIRTWVSKDVSMEGAYLTLEHEKLPFELHPSESSAYMHWLSAKVIVDTALELSRHGYVVKDAHPWNIMFSKGHPKFVDFGSLIPGKTVTVSWFNEFKTYFAVPIWLDSSKRWKHLAPEYRREHLQGFGLNLLGSDCFLHNLIMRDLNKVKSLINEPEKFFSSVIHWLDKYGTVNVTNGLWSDYDQSHGSDPTIPLTTKQKFVYDILSRKKPKKVLDCASNNGFYSEMAAKLGASVAAFDYEENCVNECLSLAQRQRLDITPAVMDFNRPTAEYGIGLLGRSAIKRFKSDIVLVLGIIHHLCIAQNLPVGVFCDICMKYADSGIIMEYVDPDDKHLEHWNKSLLRGYELENICMIFKNKFSKVDKSALLSDNGICRYMLYFYND